MLQMPSFKKYRIALSTVSIFAIGISVLYSTTFTSCAPEIEDNSIDRKWVDSLEKEQKKLLGIEMDSLCELRREKFIKNAVDSIMGERLEEMRKFGE